MKKKNNAVKDEMTLSPLSDDEIEEVAGGRQVFLQQNQTSGFKSMSFLGTTIKCPNKNCDWSGSVFGLIGGRCPNCKEDLKTMLNAKAV